MALLLAALGVYGVIALVVAERTAELGLRAGARARCRPHVARLVVGDALRVTALGGVAGLAVAAGAAPVIASQLYGVRPLDPVTFVAVPPPCWSLRRWPPRHRRGGRCGSTRCARCSAG